MFCLEAFEWLASAATFPDSDACVKTATPVLKRIRADMTNHTT